jgi:hypothetical protein
MRFSTAYAAHSLLVAFVLLSAAFEVQAEQSQQSPSLSSLLSRFAAMPGLEARFREEKHIELLAAPLVSEGSLLFAPPGMLLRHTQSPAASTVLIRDGELRFTDGRRSGQVDLDANPTVRHFVESFVLLLAGDEAALRRLYDVTMTQDDPNVAESWELLLVPRPQAMRRVLRDVRLRGVGVTLREMRVREVSGDETVTTFTNVNPARRYTESERTRLFRIPSP